MHWLLQELSFTLVVLFGLHYLALDSIHYLNVHVIIFLFGFYFLLIMLIIAILLLPVASVYRVLVVSQMLCQAQLCGIF